MKPPNKRGDGCGGGDYSQQRAEEPKSQQQKKKKIKEEKKKMKSCGQISEKNKGAQKKRSFQ